MRTEALLDAAEAFALPFYSEPHRAYHNAGHVRALLHALEKRQVLTPLLALAVWGHDLIYDTRRHDNEERSAEVFGAWLDTQGANPTSVQDVRRLILATRHTSAPTDHAEALLVDADLSILGADAEAFATYDAAIRQEYRHVPGLLYRRGRAKVLKSFLDRPRIFITPEFSGLEAQARANLTTRIATL